MYKLAKHIIAVAKKNNLKVMNMQVQKIMFFIIQDYLAENGVDEFITELYDIPFHPWKYGPTVPNVYLDYSLFGSADVTSISNETFYNEDYALFDKNIVKYLKKDIFDLVDETIHTTIYQKQKDNVDYEYTLLDITKD